MGVKKYFFLLFFFAYLQADESEFLVVLDMQLDLINKALTTTPHIEQIMQPASSWAKIAQGQQLSRNEMLKSFINDCNQLKKENTIIPIHIKNDKTVRIMSYNIHEWKDPFSTNDFDAIIGVIKNINPDILILQEASQFDEVKINSMFSSLGYKGRFFCVAAAPWLTYPFGNMVFTKYKGQNSVTKVFNIDKGQPEERCYVRTTLQLPQQKKITIYGTHLDVWDNSGEKRKQELQEILADIGNAQENILIAADFNSVRKSDYNYVIGGKTIWDLLTESELKRTTVMPSTHVLDLLEQRGFVDCFAKNNQKGPGFTVWTGTVVDFMFVNKDWQLTIAGCYVYYDAASDHIPVIMDIIV